MQQYCLSQLGPIKFAFGTYLTTSVFRRYDYLHILCCVRFNINSISLKVFGLRVNGRDYQRSIPSAASSKISTIPTTSWPWPWCTGVSLLLTISLTCRPSVHVSHLTHFHAAKFDCDIVFTLFLSKWTTRRSSAAQEMVNICRRNGLIRSASRSTSITTMNSMGSLASVAMISSAPLSLPATTANSVTPIR